MTDFDLLFKQKLISRTDWQTARFYKKVRHMVLRSMAIKDALHMSSFEKATSVKGVVLDPSSSYTLEQFWKGVDHYFKDDPLPVITILDSITGFYYPYLNVPKEVVRTILKKFRKIIINLDVIALFQKIEEDLAKSSHYLS